MQTTTPLDSAGTLKLLWIAVTNFNEKHKSAKPSAHTTACIVRVKSCELCQCACVKIGHASRCSCSTWCCQFSLKQRLYSGIVLGKAECCWQSSGKLGIPLRFCKHNCEYQYTCAPLLLSWMYGTLRQPRSISVTEHFQRKPHKFFDLRCLLSTWRRFQDEQTLHRWDVT